MYLETFPDSDYEHFWKAMSASCRLFRQIAFSLADILELAYPKDYEDGFMKYMEIVKAKMFFC